MGREFLVELQLPVDQRRMIGFPLVLEAQFEIIERRRQREMSAMELLACFRRIGAEMSEPARRLLPLPVYPRLMDLFLVAEAPLVDDRQQAIADAVAERLEVSTSVRLPFLEG